MAGHFRLCFNDLGLHFLDMSISFLATAMAPLFSLGLGDALVGLGLARLQLRPIFAEVGIGDIDGQNLVGGPGIEPLI